MLSRLLEEQKVGVLLVAKFILFISFLYLLYLLYVFFSLKAGRVPFDPVFSPSARRVRLTYKTEFTYKLFTNTYFKLTKLFAIRNLSIISRAFRALRAARAYFWPCVFPERAWLKRDQVMIKFCQCCIYKLSLNYILQNFLSLQYTRLKNSIQFSFTIYKKKKESEKTIYTNFECHTGAC